MHGGHITTSVHYRGSHLNPQVFGEGDWPFRPMVITDSRDRDRGGGVHFWQLCCGWKGAAGQGRTRWSVDRAGSPWEGPVRGAERPSSATQRRAWEGPVVCGGDRGR